MSDGYARKPRTLVPHEQLLWWFHSTWIQLVNIFPEKRINYTRHSTEVFDECWSIRIWIINNQILNVSKIKCQFFIKYANSFHFSTNHAFFVLLKIYYHNVCLYSNTCSSFLRNIRHQFYFFKIIYFKITFIFIEFKHIFRLMSTRFDTS